MVKLHIQAYVMMLDVQGVREVLEENRNEINYKGKCGISLLHSLISCVHRNKPEKLKKALEVLAVLMEYGIDPTIKMQIESQPTAKESAQHLEKPQELIDVLEAYEMRWKAKHATSTENPTSHLRRRHQQNNNSTTVSASTSNTLSMQLHQ